MTTDKNFGLKAGLLSLVILVLFLFSWHALVVAQQGPPAEGLVWKDQGRSGFP